MIKRMAWAWMPIAGLVLWGAEPRLCAAQGAPGSASAGGAAGGQGGAGRLLALPQGGGRAMITFNGNFEGLHLTVRFGEVLVLVNRPQEVVFALQLMKLAFDEYSTTVADFNKAQFELFHSIGYPARELAQLRPPGEVVPVDTSRPACLPPVGNGPPPATR